MSQVTLKKTMGRKANLRGLQVMERQIKNRDRFYSQIRCHVYGTEKFLIEMSHFLKLTGSLTQKPIWLPRQSSPISI